MIGAALGGVFGVLFAFGNGRIGNLGPAPTAALLALVGLVTIYVVPALKYPANPPAVGQGDLLGEGMPQGEVRRPVAHPRPGRRREVSHGGHGSSPGMLVPPGGQTRSAPTVRTLRAQTVYSGCVRPCE